MIRPGAPADLSFLREMLYEAVFWNRPENRPPMEDIFSIPEISKILENWGREKDFSLIAVDDQNRKIGGEWYRFWTKENHSFGFVDEETPELGIAVIAKMRGRGIGTRLMTRIMRLARTQGIQKISLSVESGNPARRLYEKLGFRKIGAVETSWTMVADLESVSIL